jgi:hypothetical protein
MQLESPKNAFPVRFLVAATIETGSVLFGLKKLRYDMYLIAPIKFDAII